MSLLPTSFAEGDTRTEDVDNATVIGLNDKSNVFSVLAAEVAREIVIELYENPAAASELATSVGTSVQNVQYHLENLVDADVIEAVGTQYSSRGREMTVYAPMDNPLTVVVGDAEYLDTCRALTDTDAE